MNDTLGMIRPPRLTLILNDLRLPAITRVWPEYTARADKET